MFSPKNILVTGAAGFIGSNFVRMMLKKYPDLNIISLDKLTYAGSLTNLAGLMDLRRHRFICGDINDRQLVMQIMDSEKIDTIVHFAAESHVDNSISNPDVFIETNVKGTLSLLQVARQYWIEQKSFDLDACRFHHVSTDEVYGSLKRDAPAFTEHSHYAPNSPYSASKAASDHLVRAFYHTYALPVTISNCSNNYGPCQHAEKLIPTIIQACLKQKSIPVYGDGSNIRDWLFVEDHCYAIDHIIRRARVGETYNIGGDNELDNLSLVKKICSLMNALLPVNLDYQNLITFVEDRKGHDWRYAINSQKICNELAWRPSHDFEHNLVVTLQHYLSNSV